MPYSPLSKRERSRWMTLAEVVRHIQASTGTEWVAAVDELRAAMGQGLVTARWAFDPSREAVFIEPAPIFSVDPVPTGSFYWAYALIFLDGDGAVVDQSYLGETTATPQRRGLFLLRSRVLELWHPSKQSHTEQKNLRPKPATSAQIRDEARKIYRAGKFGPNIRKAEELIRQALGNAPRKRVRDVLEDPEFASHRRARGKRDEV